MDFPLHCEVTLNSSLETVENCLKGGEDPNSRDDYGNTPLHCVNYYDEEAYKMVQLLLNHGADLLTRDGVGRLPFQHALDCANTKACQTFMDWGFSLQKSDRMLNGTYELLNNVELFQHDMTRSRCCKFWSTSAWTYLQHFLQEVTTFFAKRSSRVLA